MQLFAVLLSRDGRRARDVGAALRAAARGTPHLDAATLKTEHSASGRLSYAAITHAAAQIPPRRYAAERGPVRLLFDGFPLDQEGSLQAHDAAALLERWQSLPGRLDGIFSAVRLDLSTDAVQCLLDPLGMARIFVCRRAGALMLSNSVEAIRVELGLAAPDPLGVSSLLSLGYVANGRTLLAGVESLPGGARHHLTATSTASEPYFTPASVLAARPPREELSRRLLALTRAAVESGAALRSALTSGRDTRVLLALLRAAGAAGEVDFYTSGGPADLDVRIARELAERFGLTHRLLAPVAAEGAAWAQQTTRFVIRTDGVANLELVSDFLDHEQAVQRLALELWGAAGEIGRTHKHVLGPLMSMTPILRRSYLGRRRVLVGSVGDPAATLRGETLELARRHLRAFVARRREEDWPADALDEAFYAFEFLPARPAMGVRRASASADLFSPFATRAFVEHCFGVSAAERYLEHPHHALVERLAPEVDAVPYEVPWKPQRPGLALPLAGDDALRRLGRRIRGTSPPREAGGTPFYVSWYEAGLEQHRDLTLSIADSPLWDFVDRERYVRLLRATPQEREPYVRALTRVLSVVWYLHGDRERA